MLRLLLALLIAIPPRPAAYLAGWAEGVEPQVLLRICHRESRCSALALHAGDAGAGATHWRLAVRGGALDPEACPLHRTPGRRWSTSGAWGMVRAYALRRLPGPLSCWAPPEVLDVPLVGALVAARTVREAKHPAFRRWAGDAPGRT